MVYAIAISTTTNPFLTSSYVVRHTHQSHAQDSIAVYEMECKN